MTWQLVAALAIGIGGGVALAFTGHETMGATVAGGVITGVFTLLRPGPPPPPAVAPTGA